MIFHAAASFTFVLFSCLTAYQAYAQKPNIIYILCDDLGYSDLGAYGGEIDTPNLDALAAEGAAFNNFYVQPRCSPTRAAIMTGHQNHAVGFSVLISDHQDLNRNHVFLPELLRTAGYDTYLSGKWHLGGTDNFGTNGPIPGDTRTDPRVRGFDHVFTFDNSSHSEFNWNPNNYRLLSDSSPGNPAVAPRSYATSPGSTYYNRSPGNPAVSTFYQTDAITDYAIDFIRHNKARNQTNSTDKPFFLYIAYGAPHFPLEAPKQIVDQYVARYSLGWDSIRSGRLQAMIAAGVIPPDVLQTPRGEVQQRLDSNDNPALHEVPAWADIPAARKTDLVRRMAVFAAMVDVVDRNIGLILDELESSGEINNTLIMFSTDNGANAEWHEYGKQFDEKLYSVTELPEMGTNADGHNIFYGTGWANTGSTPFRNYKHYTHEGGIKSPLIVSWPGQLHASLIGNMDDSEAGMFFVEQVLHVTDIYATLLDVAGVSLPSQWAAQNGVTYSVKDLDPNVASFKDLLLTGIPIGDREFGIEHEGNRMYRDGEWKLVSSNYADLYGKPANAWELYNLADDPTELNDLAGDPAQLSRLLTMVDQYNQWALRNNVISSLPPGPVIPPDPLEPRPNDLFVDSFSRSDSKNADASAGGMSGSAVPPLGAESAYYEGFEGSGSADSITIDATMLRMATGPGMSESGIMHNFIDQDILDGRGFSIGIEVLQIDSANTDTANRFAGFGVGLSQAEAASGADINDSTAQSFRAGLADFFVELNLNGDVQVRSEGALLATVNVGAVQGRLEARLYVSGFDHGQTATAAVFFEGQQLDINPADADKLTRTFTWDGTSENYIGLSARASNRVLIDNLRVAELVRGDLDNDGDVDDADFGLAFAAFTGPGGGPSVNPAADLDGDGDVDDADFGLMFAEFTGPQ